MLSANRIHYRNPGITKPNQTKCVKHEYLNVGAGLYFGAFLLVVVVVEAAADSVTSIALATPAARATSIKKIWLRVMTL